MKVGILGGGQLGRMLLQQAANYTVETYVLENDENCPAAHLCHHFIKGNIQDFDAVYNFGKHLDALTIEIEAVNIDALFKLEEEGVKIFPKPSAIKIIKNKILQKNSIKIIKFHLQILLLLNHWLMCSNILPFTCCSQNWRRWLRWKRCAIVAYSYRY
jgi:phosphoribosylaminoimidazole carboxylase (NCAIR synthetase)